MDKRSWPWRKKSSEKILVSNDSPESSPVHLMQHPDDQAVSTILADHTHLLMDEGTVQWQQSEEKVKHLSERLSVALLDASAKDELIKQHAKVAEEAVSGWEKAEAEAATLKQQLDSVIQQKLATEDRVSHLDGALKECMRQLRRVREEQEEKIHDATVKNTREWERVRSELEEKLVDVEQKYLERDAENKVISKLLQERAISISEIGEARSRAEAELNVLQIRRESMEKEIVALKYECTVLKEELDMRNEERVLSKRSSEAANREHLEDARKIAKLEGECQRLRGLVRKKLPGPGALAQMKLEAESPRDKNDSNRRRIGKGAGFPREKAGDTGLNMAQEEASNIALVERLSTMEEETRRLKELLARRDSELQHARLMCARMASKLSSVEEQVESLSHAQGVLKTAGMSALDEHVEAARSFTVSCEPSLASVSEDGNDDTSDAWASALIAELAYFKKGKATSCQEAALHVPKMQHDNLMEMESPVSLEHDVAAKKGPLNTLNGGGISIEQNLAQKDAELHAVHQLCDQVSTKLATAEKELAALRSQNAATQLSLQGMQAQLDKIFQAQDDGGNVEIVLDQVRAAMGIPQHARLLLEEVASSPATDVGPKSFAVGPDLTSAICKLVEIMEDLAINLPEFPILMHREPQHDIIDTQIHEYMHTVPSVHWKTSNFDAKIKGFIAASNLFLLGKADIIHFVGDLSSVLSNLVRARPSVNDASPHITRKPFYWDKMSLASGEAEDLSGANSPISDTSKSDGSEKQATKVVPHDGNNSIIAITKECPLQEDPRIEELRKVQAEKVAMETHMRVEFQRFGDIEHEVARLRVDKLELENKLQVAKEELDHLKTKLHRAEEVESNLCAELTSAKSSRQLIDEQLSSLNVFKAESESQLKVSLVERDRLQDRVGVLEIEVQEKHEKNAELETKCQELKEQLLKKSDSTCSRCDAVNIDGGQSKEQEIAAKLSECQQTILVLGKQLKALTSPKAKIKTPHDQSGDQPVSPVDAPSRQFLFSQSPSELHPEEAGEIRSLLEVHSGTSAHKKSRRHRRAKKELVWDPRRDSSASDILDSELVSLSKSGRPLLELFEDNTHAHEHYIQAVEQLPSSSEGEAISPKRMEPVLSSKGVVPSSSKPPLHRKKKSPRLFTGVDMSKSMDDATSDKHNSSFTRLFFSRAKNPEPKVVHRS